MTRTFALASLLLGATAGAAPTTGDVVFAVAKKPVHVRCELALTPADQQHGLMDRRSLADGTGMLFVFALPGVHNFWMHNTYIPLDMIFLDAGKKVVSVVERAEPLTDTPRGPREKTQYVVEVPGGWARSHGIGPGVSATFSGVPDGAQ